MLKKHADALEGVVKAYTRNVKKHVPVHPEYVAAGCCRWPAPTCATCLAREDAGSPAGHRWSRGSASVSPGGQWAARPWPACGQVVAGTHWRSPLSEPYQ